jgi:hypothetical protein
MVRGRKTFYDGPMGAMPISMPENIRAWLKDRPEGASEWIRVQAERQMKSENVSVRIKEAIMADMERAKQDLEAIEMKEQEELKDSKDKAMKEEFKAEFTKVRGEIDQLKALSDDFRQMYNMLYIYYKGKKKGFSPLTDYEDAKTILEAFKIEIANEEIRIKAEMEQAKKEADKVLGITKPKED